MSETSYGVIDYAAASWYSRERFNHDLTVLTPQGPAYRNDIGVSKTFIYRLHH